MDQFSNRSLKILRRVGSFNHKKKVTAHTQLGANHILTHAIQLQQDLMTIQKKLDLHESPANIWKNSVLQEGKWLEQNCDIELGSPLATAIQDIINIYNHGGPTQGNEQSLISAIEHISKFIGSIKKRAS